MENYGAFDAHETQMAARFRAFLSEKGEHFGRDLCGRAPDWGHVTGSAWIVDKSGENVVLLYHRKLEKWVQPGGHCDGQSDVLSVALREAREETGMKVSSVDGALWDVDAHQIPQYWNTPAHVHYDARFLLRADSAQNPIVSDESRAVRWVSLDEALQLSSEESIARMIEKTRRRFGSSQTQ